MSRIFLSHSSSNNAEAVALRDWLVAEGWDDLFLDLDPKRGIRAGERWERALHDALSRCEAAVFLVSKAWLASVWCRKEFELASKLCGHLFVVLIEDIAVKDLPRELTQTRQIVDLAKGADHAMLRATLPDGGEQHVTFAKGGLQALKGGLIAAGLDPRFFVWPPENDPDRPPYRGMLSMEAADAGIFFGREAPIVDALERLRKLREAGPPRFFVILGASGAGKSSFLRAGLLPRLARGNRNFLILPVIRPERAVMSGETGLLNGLERACKAQGLKHSRAEIKRAVFAGSPDLHGLFAALTRKAALSEAHSEARVKPPTIVLAIDQAEELFQAEGADEADAFLKLLRDLLFADDPEALVIVTIRSDSYDRLQTAPPLVGISQQPFSLQPMPKGAYQSVIEGPAAKLQDTTGRILKIDPQLTQALLADIEEGGAKDALPLLAFTLERLFLEHGGDGDLRLDEYHELGGINGSIEAAVVRALKAADNDPAVPKDPAARLALMRRAFIPWLAGIDPDTGSPRRAIARLADIPEEARPLVRHLIDQRLLATDRDQSGETTIEPAHEALLRQWGLLKGWLEEDFAQLSALEAVRRATRDWLANDKSPHWLVHNSGRLEDSERLKDRADLAAKMESAERDYLAACREAETARQKKELRQARRLTRAIAIGFIAAVILAAIAAGFGHYGFRKAEEAQQEKQKAINNEGIAFSGLSRVALSEGRPVQAVKLALAAWPRHGDKGRSAQKRIIEDLAAALPKQRQRMLLRGHEASVASASFSPDGERVVTTSGDSTARLWDVRTGAENAVLRGHEGPVTSASFSPDGTRVVTASEDGTARLWHVGTGAEIAVLGHQASVTLASFSPDGARVVTASEDGTARLWHAGTGAEIAVLGHQASLTSASFSPDGTRLATASGDRTVHLWDARTGAEIAVLIGHEARVLSVRLSPDGARVVTASEDNTARLWNAMTGAQIAVLSSHEDWVTSASFSPDGTRVVTASGDYTARLWDAGTGAEISVLRGHEAWLNSASFSPDSTRVVTASSDNTARLWDTRTGVQIAVLRSHDNLVWSASFSPDGTRVVTASEDKTARLWDAGMGTEIFMLRGHKDLVSSAGFSPDGTRVVTTSGDGSARLWHAGTGAENAVLRGHGGPIIEARFSPNGTRVVTASEDKTARLWDAETGAEIIVLRGHEASVSSAGFSPDGTRLVTASKDNTARLWDTKIGAEIAVLRGHENTIFSASFSPDGTQVVTASGDYTARLWDAGTGAEISVLRGHENTVISASFSPDGVHVVTASEDKTARLWDARTGAEVKVLRGHEAWLSAASFSPDGTRVVTASGDNTARLWDTGTGAEIAVLRSHENAVWSASFSPDGTRVVTASEDATVRLWDAETGAEIVVLRGHEASVSSAIFSPDGTRLVTASRDNTARLWDASSVEKGDAFVIACQRLGNETDLTDVRERYGLGEIIPICGENAPLPVDLTKPQ